MRLFRGAALALSVLTIGMAARAASRSWTSGGPGPATAVAAGVADARTLWTAVPASTGATEIFRSDDAATTWRPVGMAPLSSVTRISPGPAGILYAAGYQLGGGDFPVSDATIAKSVDGGASWRVVYSSGYCHVIPIVQADPRDPSVAFAADNISCHGFGGTLLRTTDGGATWKGISPPLPADLPPTGFPAVAGFAASASDSRVLYLVQGGGWRSDDGGETWTAIPAPGSSDVAVDPASSRLVYETDYATGGFFRSDDGGETWEPTALAGTPGIMQLMTDPFVPDSVFARTWNDVFASFDRGATWRELPSIGRTINDLAVGNGRIYAATDDGVFVFHGFRVIAVPPAQTGPVTSHGKEGSARAREGDSIR